MKTTLITTCLNEEKTIVSFLESVFVQTELPDEVIIVDGGSSDRTLSEISNFKGGKTLTLALSQEEREFWFSSPLRERMKVRGRLLIKKGNRSVGRNEAIAKASHEIILCSDVGCILDKNWVKNITEPFRDTKTDIVSGYYLPITNSVFEKCLATYTCVMPDKVNPEHFLPSSRSVAFRRKVWKEVGGYPKELNTCEDLVFDKKLQARGFRFVFAKDAIVFWPQRKNLWQAFKQFYSYAKGDGQAHYFRKSTPFLFARYFFASLFIVVYFISRSSLILTTLYLILFLYILWSIWKNYNYIKHWQALFLLPVLQFTSDIAVIFGMMVVLFPSFLNKFQSEF